MSSDARPTPSPTFVAAALLLLLLTVLAVLGAAPVTSAPASARTAPERHDTRTVDSLRDLVAAAPTARWSLAPRLDNAVVSCDLGLDPRALIAAASDLLLQAAPQLHATAATWIAQFHAWSGLSPTADLLPFLESDVTCALYVARQDDALWPLPRPVVVLRIAEPAPVARFVARWTRWKAAAVAPVSGGLFGASAISGELAGYPFFGLDIDSIARLPLPAPTAVVLDRLLVISPSRTAAEEATRSLAEGPGAPDVPRRR